MTDSFLLAIPVFNEARHVAGVLTESRRYLSDVLVIDDGSTDATRSILDQQPDLHVIRHPENLGYGASLADAFRFARRRGFRWLITMDCDQQHEPMRLPEFIRACRADDADIISGSRYLDDRLHVTTAPEDRRRINRCITDLLNRRLGLNLTDAFCEFKAYRVSRLDRFRITVPGYAMPLQFWVQAWRAGLRIGELPVGLIYNDPDRHFGGLLDNPDARLAHYLEVFHDELAHPHAANPAGSPPQPAVTAGFVPPFPGPPCPTGRTSPAPPCAKRRTG